MSWFPWETVTYQIPAEIILDQICVILILEELSPKNKDEKWNSIFILNTGSKSSIKEFLEAAF